MTEQEFKELPEQKQLELMEALSNRRFEIPKTSTSIREGISWKGLQKSTNQSLCKGGKLYTRMLTISNGSLF